MAQNGIRRGSNGENGNIDMKSEKKKKKKIIAAATNMEKYEAINQIMKTINVIEKQKKKKHEGSRKRSIENEMAKMAYQSISAAKAGGEQAA